MLEKKLPTILKSAHCLVYNLPMAMLPYCQILKLRLQSSLHQMLASGQVILLLTELSIGQHAIYLMSSDFSMKILAIQYAKYIDNCLYGLAYAYIIGRLADSSGSSSGSSRLRNGRYTWHDDRPKCYTKIDGRLNSEVLYETISQQCYTKGIVQQYYAKVVQLYYSRLFS